MYENENKKKVTAVLKFLLAAALAFWGAFLLTLMWQWTAVEIFSLPKLTLPQAYALWALIAFLTHESTKDENAKVSEVQRYATAFIRPLVYTFTIFVASLFY